MPSKSGPGVNTKTIPSTGLLLHDGESGYNLLPERSRNGKEGAPRGILCQGVPCLTYRRGHSRCEIACRDISSAACFSTRLAVSFGNLTSTGMFWLFASVKLPIM